MVIADRLGNGGFYYYRLVGLTLDACQRLRRQGDTC